MPTRTKSRRATSPQQAHRDAVLKFVRDHGDDLTPEAFDELSAATGLDRDSIDLLLGQLWDQELIDFTGLGYRAR